MHDRTKCTIKTKWCALLHHTLDEQVALKSSYYTFSVSILDVAVRKCHQRQDESMIFLPALYWNQQSCFSVSNAQIYDKRMLCEMRAFMASAKVYAVGTGFY